MHEKLVLSCEHASAAIPPDFTRFFRGQKRILETHQAFDPGALELAVRLKCIFKVPLYAGKNSRLLVDLNRSTAKGKGFFSRFTRNLSPELKEEIIRRFHAPYYRKLHACAREFIKKGYAVLHLSVHSFTPVLHGKPRRADIGILFDPARPREKRFALEWKKNILAADRHLRVRFNYPYKGVSDGMTAYLRRHFGGRFYAGIELEINQKFVKGPQEDWITLQQTLVLSLKQTLRKGTRS